jgi:ketosteroid isomerase-like protein
VSLRRRIGCFDCWGRRNFRTSGGVFSEAQWSRTAAANDLEGCVSYYSDDASILPPNAPISSGKQVIRAVWASVLGPGVSVSWQVSKLEVSRSGDLAYAMSVYQFAQKEPQGKPVTDHGKTVD